MKTLFAMILVAALPAQAPPPVRVVCPGEICAMPADDLRRLLELHNLHVDTITDLRRELGMAETKCRHERNV